MGFNSIALGFLFFIDFRLNGFDILPDIVGYILIIYGLRYLAEENQSFRLARSMAIPLTVTSVFDIYQAQQNANNVSFEFTLNILFTILTTILFILMVYNLCMGIGEKARNKEDFEMENLALRRWKIFITYQVLFLIMILLGIVVPPMVLLMFIPMFIFCIVSLVLMITLFMRADTRFRL
ncbi:MAG: hypothetical protein Q8930_09805 [Bacillota bacterium]|nr:hypothetical protein [Bacillota bacterium]